MEQKTKHRRLNRSDPQKKVVEAYVDTSAFIAFLDRSDSHHSIFSHLFSTAPPLVTSALVIAEGHGWFLRRYDRYRATEFLAFVEILKPLNVLGFDSAAILKTRQMLAKFSDQNLTLADAHGLVVMKDCGSAVCWSTDRHLGLMGVALV